MKCFYEQLTGNKPRPVRPIVQTVGPYCVLVNAQNQSLIFKEPPGLISFPLWINRYMDYHWHAKSEPEKLEYFNKHCQPAIDRKLGDLKYTMPLVCVVSDDKRDSFPSDILLGEWLVE